jgi:hypothetical protein
MVPWAKLTLSEAGMFLMYCFSRKGTFCREVRRAFDAIDLGATHHEDVLLDPGNAGAEEDDGKEGNAAEHASLDTAVVPVSLVQPASTWQPQ